MSTRRLWSIKYLLAIAFSVLLLDQVTKLLVENISALQYKYLLPFLNFHVTYNKGAAFGFLSNQPWATWVFVAIAFVVSICIIIWGSKIGREHKLELIALGLILGGALGNLLDRIRLRYVIDFIDFHIGNWHWYTFNVADIAVCVGAIILAIYTIIRG